tara:strand:- start:168 stop:578 length:411 start_codon:yes stop_codon:yes gene_type:complete
MAKKQKSFADKAVGNKDKDAVYVKYVKSVKSDKTGQWRFNEQMIRTNKGEQLDAALKRMDEIANLADIDLSEFVSGQEPVEEQDVENTAVKADDAPSKEVVADEQQENKAVEEIENAASENEIPKADDESATDEEE